MPRSRRIGAAAASVALGVVAVACGSDDSASGVSLPPSAAEGRQVSIDAGCAGCHGKDGQGGVGPAWTGLAGSTVSLADGTTVVADDDYLRRSITDPRAQVPAGYTIVMPTNTLLTPEQIDALVAYINALG